jgi:hypothetical protein
VIAPSIAEIADLEASGPFTDTAAWSTDNVFADIEFMGTVIADFAFIEVPT